MALLEYAKLLCMTCAHGWATAVSILLQARVPTDLVVETSEGGLRDTPLIAACKRQHHDIISLLLRRGANPAVTTPDGSTAMKFAKDAKDKKTVLLVRASPPPSPAAAPAPRRGPPSPAQQQPPMRAPSSSPPPPFEPSPLLSTPPTPARTPSCLFHWLTSSCPPRLGS